MRCGVMEAVLWNELVAPFGHSVRHLLHLLPAKWDACGTACSTDSLAVFGDIPFLQLILLGVFQTNQPAAHFGDAPISAAEAALRAGGCWWLPVVARGSHIA